MKPHIRRVLASLAGALWLGAAAAPSQAALVTSSFNGTVTGYQWGFVNPASSALDEDNPLGTPVQWSLTFDDSFLSLGYPAVFSETPAVSGSLHVGSDEYAFTAWQWFSLSFTNDFSTIVGYRPQILATGPATSDGADFFGMFWSFGPDLSLVASPMIGFAYSVPGVTTYAYLLASGDYSVAPVSTVPEPATAWLALPALMFLLRRRGRG